MKFQHPCFGFFPALPLQKNLELGDWVVGVPAEDTPWRSARFKELVSKLLDSFASDKFGDKFSGGALVWRKAAGFDGTPPSPDEFVAIQAAVRFAALDSNDRVDKEDQNGGHYLVTSENAALHVQPIDEGTGHITLVRQGLLKRILTGGWTIGQRPPPLADATMPMLGQVLASNKLSAAIFQAHVAPNTELLRRLRIAIEWHTVALSNPVAVTIQQRLIALKTGFEALTGTSASRECARKLRHLFETTTESHRNLLPWAGILWSPTERTDLLRYTQKGKQDLRSELEDWFMTLADARNSIIHHGRVSVHDYGPPLERPLSRYTGKLFWIGERILREAIKACLGAEVLLCGRIQEWALFERLFSQIQATPQPTELPGTAVHPDHAAAPPARSLAVLLQELGCQAANQIQLRKCTGGSSASEEVARQMAAASRDAWEAHAGPRSIYINSSERELLEKAGAEEELPDHFALCD